MSYIHVSIENAGLMVSAGMSTIDNYSRYVGNDGKYMPDRNKISPGDIDAIEHPFKLNHLSNMIHVLCGCRPVSTFYNFAKLERVHEIDEIAANSLYRISNSYYRNGVNKKILTYEIGHGSNILEDSNRTDIFTVASDGMKFPTIYLTWAYFEKRYQNYDESHKDYKDYKNIILLFEHVSGMKYDEIKKKYSLVDFMKTVGVDADKRKILTESKYINEPYKIMMWSFIIYRLSECKTYADFVNEINKYTEKEIKYVFEKKYAEKLMSLKNYDIYSKKDFSDFYNEMCCNIKKSSFNDTKSGGADLRNDAVLVNNIQTIKRCSLYIDVYIPMYNKKITDAILCGTRYARFLDGGMAEYVKCVDLSEDYLLSQNYKKCSV